MCMCVYFSVHHFFPYFPRCKGPSVHTQPCPPLPSATTLCSVSPPAFNPWLETAGVTLSRGRVQSGEPNQIVKEGDAGKIAGGGHNVYSVIRRKAVFFSLPSSSSSCFFFFFFFHNHIGVFAYKWQPPWLSRKKCSGDRETNDKWRWSVMSAKCRQDRQRWSRLICLWGSAPRAGGKCHCNHDLNWTAGVKLQKYEASQPH